MPRARIITEIPPGKIAPSSFRQDRFFGPSSEPATIVVPLIDAAPTIYAPSIGAPTVASGDEANPAFVIKIVGKSGGLQKTLTVAQPETVTWTLNQNDECAFHFPKGSYTMSDVAVLGNPGSAKEVQVYRNGDLIFWGPIISITANGADGAVTCHCAGVDWYLNRRFIDAPITNRLTNPDAESGMSSWGTSGDTLTATATTQQFKTGQHSFKLVNASDAGGEDFITQTVTAGPNGVGLLLTLSAWFFIESLSANPPHGFGIYMAGTHNGVFQIDNAYEIEEATPRGKWTKGSCTLWIPPNETWSIEVRLYAPKGTTYYDDVKLVSMQSVSAAQHNGLTFIPTDIAYTINRLVTFVQDSAFGKDNLNISTHCELTGIKVLKAYQFVDHQQFDQALRELVERNDGSDFAVKYTPTTRVFHSYANKRGVDRTASVTLEYTAGDDTKNCTTYRFSEDGGGCITRAITLGEDNGPDREQGEAADSAQIGGTILQDVRQAPQDSETASLQPLAEETLARFKVVPQTIEMDVRGDSGLIPTLKTGDMVRVTVSDGFVDVDDDYRIMRLSLACKTNILTVTLTIDTLS